MWCILISFIPYRPEVPRQNPLELLIHTLKKMKGRRGKNSLFQGWVLKGRG
jgi:hypothetical protein